MIFDNKSDNSVERSTSSEQTQDLEDQTVIAGNLSPGKETNINEKDEDLFRVKWDGIDDKEDIQKSHSLFLRWIYALIISFCSIVITCTSSVYSMAVEDIQNEFGASHTVAVLGITFFLLGMGIGPMFLSPISEFHGRKVVYICSLTFIIPFMLLTGFAKNLPAVFLGRFLAGLSGSAFMGVASGSFSDLFTADEIMIPVMVYTLTPFLGPGLGPLMGGFIVHNLNWRWTSYIMAMASGLMLVLIVFVVPETYHPILLKKKAERLRKEKNDNRYYAPLERSNKSIVDTIFLSCVRPMKMMVFEPMLLLICIYSGLLLSILYLFFVSFPYVFRTVYNFNETHVGLVFISLIIGCLLAAPTVVFNKKYIVPRCIARNPRHVYEPEFQLPQTYLGAVLVPVGLFIFAWTSSERLTWAGPVIAGGTISMGMVICFNGLFAFTIDAYRMYAASAMACNGVIRSSMGSVFPIFGLQMYENLGIQWATTLIALICLAFIPMPFLFFKYGSRIRAKSRFGWTDDI